MAKTTGLPRGSKRRKESYAALGESIMSSDRLPTSPWQRYKKKKWVYSTVYQLWREAVLKDGAGSPKALALACQHAKTQSVKAEACVSV